MLQNNMMMNPLSNQANKETNNSYIKCLKLEEQKKKLII